MLVLQERQKPAACEQFKERFSRFCKVHQAIKWVTTSCYHHCFETSLLSSLEIFSVKIADWQPAPLMLSNLPWLSEEQTLECAIHSWKPVFGRRAGSSDSSFAEKLSGDEAEVKEKEPESIFSQLERMREELEKELGFDAFLNAYKCVQVNAKTFIHLFIYLRLSMQSYAPNHKDTGNGTT